MVSIYAKAFLSKAKHSKLLNVTEEKENFYLCTDHYSFCTNYIFCLQNFYKNFTFMEILTFHFLIVNNSDSKKACLLIPNNNRIHR